MTTAGRQGICTTTAKMLTASPQRTSAPRRRSRAEPPIRPTRAALTTCSRRTSRCTTTACRRARPTCTSACTSAAATLATRATSLKADTTGYRARCSTSSTSTPSYLEYDTPRAGGFALLQHLPASKNVVLRVVTSKFPEMGEDREVLKRRVYEAAEVIGGGRQALRGLGVSPQCGFAIHSQGNLVGREDMVKKLRLLR